VADKKTVKPKSQMLMMKESPMVEKKEMKKMAKDHMGPAKNYARSKKG
jgi:hypothetical protein